MADRNDLLDTTPLGADPAALRAGRIRGARLEAPPRPSSWSLKVVMAVTGIVFGLFVFVHMIGNLKIYTGAAHLNDYALWLRTAFEPLLPYEGVLWILRIVLLICLIGHVGAAAILTVRARKARGPHRRKGAAMKSFVARTMPVSGVVVLAFVIFHLLDLTTGTTPIASADYQHLTPDAAYAYQNVIHSFQRPAVSAFYLIALLVLFAHLLHGFKTAVLDLGATGRRMQAVLTAIGALIALAVLLGNITIPIAVLTGVIS